MLSGLLGDPISERGARGRKGPRKKKHGGKPLQSHSKRAFFVLFALLSHCIYWERRFVYVLSKAASTVQERKTEGRIGVAGSIGHSA